MVIFVTNWSNSDRPAVTVFLHAKNNSPTEIHEEIVLNNDYGYL